MAQPPAASIPSRAAPGQAEAARLLAARLRRRGRLPRRGRAILARTGRARVRHSWFDVAGNSPWRTRRLNVHSAEPSYGVGQAIGAPPTPITFEGAGFSAYHAGRGRRGRRVRRPYRVG